MANSGINIAATPFGGKLRVERIQSVVPAKPTDPRQSKRIIISQNPSSATVLQRRFHVLFLYNKASDDDDGWLVAGRMRESLGIALQEQPLLAGRLRRREENDGGLQIVSNDSGVRLVEATAEMELGDFVEMKEKRRAEAELVFWEDVVDHNIQFSPLFYVQVTNFTCGGYSIGISCSLLQVDPFVLTSFIKKLADAHNIISRNESSKIPTFYLPNHGKPTSSPSLLMGSNTTKDVAESFIFNIPTKSLNLDRNIHKNLAALCIEEAERDAGRKLASNLSLFLKMPFEDDKVEVCSRQALLDSPKSCYSVKGLSCARTWDELELDSICFSEGHKPIYASCWINSLVDDGSVIIVPSTDDSGIKIIVTFT